MISHLGRYEVVGELGQGAMGVVYKATDPLIDRIVAIKTITLSLAQEEREEYEGRFYQEAKAAGRLSHPNIVTIYDVGRSGDIAYIAMEFLQGRELRDILNDDKLLPVDQVLDIVSQVAMGLAYAHEHGIIHRDIKPSNIMVGRDGHVKITDFGIARMASAGVRTQTGMVLGSPKYMSPEQVMGKLTDQRSDIFSLGVVLYEMLTGQPAFMGENVNAIMYQTLNAIPQPPRSLNPAVPEMLNFIVAKALAKDVENRYQNAKDFANDLRACRGTMPSTVLSADIANAPSASFVSGTAPQEGEVSEEADPAITMRLSPSFDSAGATMRLAAMTASKEDVEELSKTFKMVRPSIDEINQAAPQSPVFTRHTTGNVTYPEHDARSAKGGGLILMAIVALILIGLISALLF
ncbi:serine/threonine-protein kinase [Sideroxydans lithotrophicus]|uniref:non-specific serine/threonine protein kinase n=1 Tax=Sideroxydans lithotrophicus (strain ES-1) TaxID=580332 RepID=D5CRC2_SIDLE|nr:serine/threonine-protein kinase [Sideroxydans lithotrophicus]ADE11508.1 serine/threonine protein kinase [Sideroxydans lithotrophicus ES-1]